MKRICKTVSITICLVIIFLLTTACAGAGDWQSEPLSGGYTVMRANKKDISFCMPSDDGLAEILIEPTVTKVACTDDYILVQRKESTKIFKRYYYFVEIESKEILGPYSKKAFDELVSELNIDNISWEKAAKLERQEE